MTDEPENILEARTRRIASDVAHLVQRADTTDLRLAALEDFAANAQRFFATTQSQLTDIAAMLRRIERRLDVQDATDGDQP